MQLTRSGEYAIRCVLYLAQQPERGVSLLQDISKSQEAPRFLCAKVLQTLVRGDIVKSTRGAGGGYTLSRPASKISLLDVIECIEGPICLNYCVNKDECLKDNRRNPDDFCPVHPVWEEAQRKLREVLELHKFDKLAKKAKNLPGNAACKSSAD